MLSVRSWSEPRPVSARGRPPVLAHETRILLVSCALRLNLTERALAVLFDTTRATVHRTLRKLLPVLAGLFAPAELDTETVFLLDGTLIPVHDQTITACSNNYRRSVNIQVMASLDRKIVPVGRAWSGNRNDIVVARDTLPDLTGLHVLADTAYPSLPGVTTPPPCSEPEALTSTQIVSASRRTWIEAQLARFATATVARAVAAAVARAVAAAAVRGGLG